MLFPVEGEEMRFCGLIFNRASNLGGGHEITP